MEDYTDIPEVFKDPTISDDTVEFLWGVYEKLKGEPRVVVKGEEIRRFDDFGTRLL